MVDTGLLKRAMENLRENNFEVVFFKTSGEAVDEIILRLRKAKSISRGGSVTIENIGLISRIIEEGLPFRDYATREDRMASLDVDYYITSTNSISADGKLFNIDGSGNRVAAMSFGPRHVFIVAGVNKIVADLDAAIARVRNVAAPMNAKRLSRKTPCVATGKCSDCESLDRICRKEHVFTRSEPGRVTIFLIDEELGY
jgi:L-lactate utilization protein LutB